MGPPRPPPPLPTPRFSFPFCSLAEARPRGPRAHCVPRWPGPPLRELEVGRRRCPLGARGRSRTGGGHPVPWAPPRPRLVPFFAPTNLLGGGQGKFVPKFPLIYSKIWRRRLRVIFFSLPPTPPAPPSVVSFLSLDRIRLPHCKCICEFPVEQLLIYSAPWLWEGFSGLFL